MCRGNAGVAGVKSRGDGGGVACCAGGGAGAAKGDSSPPGGRARQKDPKGRTYIKREAFHRAPPVQPTKVSDGCPAGVDEWEGGGGDVQTPVGVGKEGHRDPWTGVDGMYKRSRGFNGDRIGYHVGGLRKRILADLPQLVDKRSPVNCKL